MDDDEEDDDEKDLIADEIFHGDGEGDLEEGEAVDEPLPRGDDDEEGEDEESGKRKGFCCSVRGRDLKVLTASTLDLHSIHLEIIFFSICTFSPQI